MNREYAFSWIRIYIILFLLYSTKYILQRYFGSKQKEKKKYLFGLQTVNPIRTKHICVQNISRFCFIYTQWSDLITSLFWMHCVHLYHLRQINWFNRQQLFVQILSHLSRFIFVYLTANSGFESDHEWKHELYNIFLIIF